MIKTIIHKLFGSRGSDAISSSDIAHSADANRGIKNSNADIPLSDAWTTQETRTPLSKRLRQKLYHNTLAASSHPKIPIIVPANIHCIDPVLISRNAIYVTEKLQKSGFRAFIVGGAVRDLLLNIAPKDFDVATDATPDEIVKLFRHARLIGRRFQIVHVQFRHETIEVSTFRALVDTAPTGTRSLDIEPVVVLPHHKPQRSSLDRCVHAVDASGRVLRDNVWGKQHEDAARRDFTVNAMYYDPTMQTVLDYHGGMDDIRAHILRMIGEPALRFREDPVRMLRVVRFSTKLNFTIEASTQAPLTELAELINNVPAARLFDEMLKLLLSGNALGCLKQLRVFGLHNRLLPLPDVTLEQPGEEHFITPVLAKADERVRSGKPVSPGFLFASLLWRDMQLRWQQYKDDGERLIPALHRAIDDVLDQRTERLAIQRRYTAEIREIWGLQPRLEKRSGRSAFKLLESQRFRAGYDFLLLRCDSGELDRSVGQWWTDFIAGDASVRHALLTQSDNERSPRKRRRRVDSCNSNHPETISCQPLLSSTDSQLRSNSSCDSSGLNMLQEPTS
ncbi:polynucleotide adenylyltransferase PcnB [Candidatus Vallotia cooleyia]|uniref:polynucleotide adenylyltransferase PcnB n=1 Tax=Candidatus Vallotiella adelgis TaxID=1177211 RepID=UPI001D01D2CC|nr:polynucleotide adenylyltransferase PcnB [Candidatus Vallotia cooleyia]UDG82155.1 Poly(A) polymerase I [Candidatus Vallotia cooleyia]